MDFSERGNTMAASKAVKRDGGGLQASESNAKRPKTAAAAGERLCAACCQSLPRSSFSKNQYKKGALAKCRSCTETPQANLSKILICAKCNIGKPLSSYRGSSNICVKCSSLVCAKCNVDKPLGAYTKAERGKVAGTAICIPCSVPSKICAKCHVEKPLSLYPKGEKAKKQGGTCRPCLEQARLDRESIVFTCAKCKLELQRDRFFAKNERKKGEGVARCRSCVEQERSEREQEAKRIREEWERQLMQPRKCQECGEAKPKEGYSRYQWHDYKIKCPQTCLVCLPLEVEEARMQKREYDEREQNWQDDKEEILSNARKGCIYYDARGNYETSTPSLEEIEEGSYCIYFRHIFLGEDAIYESQTTRGNLAVTRDDNQKLVGHVSFDQSFMDASKSLVSTPTFKIVLDGDNGHGNGWFTVQDLENEDFINSGGDDIRAVLSIVRKRYALQWIPRDDEAEPGELEMRYNNFQLVSFADNLKEAEALLQRQSEKNSWICNHLSLSREIASKIHEYVCWMPPPVLFVEPGDLCLTTEWDENSETVFLARKKSSKMMAALDSYSLK